jgi:hypothetical protein
MPKEDCIGIFIMCTPQLDLSDGVPSAPQMEIVCKSYALGKLTYQLPPSGPTNLLAFHLLRVRVLDV